MTSVELPTYEAYPELYHYTTWESAKKIIASRSLWAVRYDCLNDLTEVTHLKSELFNKIWPIVSEQIKIKKLRDGVFRRNIRGPGINHSAREEAKDLVDILYKATILGGGKSLIPAVPFFSSFCTHAKDRPYERANGLLSQWRAYGMSEEPCAIVFDTKR